MLSSGTTVYALATDDAHHFSDAAERKKAGKFAYTGDHAWIMVRAEKNQAAIRRAMLDGDFYASTGVLLDEVELSPKRLQLRAHGAGPFEFEFVGSGGRISEPLVRSASGLRPQGQTRATYGPW